MRDFPPSPPLQLGVNLTRIYSGRRGDKMDALRMHRISEMPNRAINSRTAIYRRDSYGSTSVSSAAAVSGGIDDAYRSVPIDHRRYSSRAAIRTAERIPESRNPSPAAESRLIYPIEAEGHRSDPKDGDRRSKSRARERETETGEKGGRQRNVHTRSISRGGATPTV